MVGVHAAPVLCCAARGGVLLTASSDNAVALWEEPCAAKPWSWQPARFHQSDPTIIRCAALDAGCRGDGSVGVYTGGRDGAVRALEVASMP